MALAEKRNVRVFAAESPLYNSGRHNLRFFNSIWEEVTMVAVQNREEMR